MAKRAGAKAAAAAPARLVSLLPPAAGLRLPLLQGFAPLADSEPPASSGLLVSSVELAEFVVLADFAATDGPGSTDVAARCFAALYSAAL